MGTKADLRHDPNRSCVGLAEGVDMAREIGAMKFMECSALSKEGRYIALSTNTSVSFGCQFYLATTEPP